MKGEEDFHLEIAEDIKRSGYDFCVLLLDSDPTCLVNLSEMLRKCGYRVVATTRADECASIFNNKGEKIDLLLAEFRLIEMNKYQLLEEIRSISEIPVVVVGENVENDVSDCLSRGAEFYLRKPLMESDLTYLSQFIIRRQRNFLSQALEDELNIKNTKGEKEDVDEHTGENFELGDLKKPELMFPDVENEYKETDDQLSQGKKRKERMDSEFGEDSKKDVGDEKKPKLTCAGEANNGREEPTERKENEEESVNSVFEFKGKPGLVSMERELEKWSTQPVTDFASFVHYEYEERDFEPLESIGESAGHQEIPLSPKESSNQNIAVQTHRGRAADEEPMQDGTSIADLEVDLQEGQGSTVDFDNSADNEMFSEELKP